MMNSQTAEQRLNSTEKERTSTNEKVYRSSAGNCAMPDRSGWLCIAAQK